MFFIPSDILDGTIPINKPVIAQEDTRAQKAIARVREAFNQQEQQMNIRALKSHEADCNIIDCNKPVCFKREPDKIVSDVIIEEYKRKMSLSMGNFKESKPKRTVKIRPLKTKQS